VALAVVLSLDVKQAPVMCAQLCGNVSHDVRLARDRCKNSSL
jgi:hypothetical protein